MKNFDWNEFRENKVAVHCDTEEKTNDFIEQCYRMGTIWIDGQNLFRDNKWNNYKEHTCYIYYKPRYLTIDYNNHYCFKEEGYKIVEWEIDSDFNSILEEALNSSIVPEVEKYGKELFPTKTYEYNGKKYIIIKKGNEILEFNKCKD